MTIAESVKQQFKEFFKPVNVVAVVFAVAGLYVGLWPDDKKYMCFKLTEPRLVFDGENGVRNLAISDRAGTPISGSIYLLEGDIWNCGRGVISGAEFREKLGIQVSGVTRFLETEISQQAKPQISKFSIAPSTRNALTVVPAIEQKLPSNLDINASTANFEFENLDPSHWAKFRVVFEGKGVPTSTLNGYSPYVELRKISVPYGVSWSNKRIGGLIILLMFTFGCALLTWEQVTKVLKLKTEGKPKNKIIHAIIGTLILFAATLIILSFIWNIVIETIWVTRAVGM
jgi:hypothetical protein